MARKEKSITDLILRGYEGSRNEANFPALSDEEYIGYVTASTMLQHPSSGASLIEVLLEVRRLFGEGRL